ncbi:MAG TPA: PAS domain-containing sensor histidine kinase [Anaerolinea thermolimosa]|uniref:histidine kinase n=1 Tax=Anaerolinea thermolimosa TaxID=229919 RepID=A0A3D1JDT6_9CHLR|nr:PAS domain-containing sensor histidine kinase [Anaerolinea thermolimosa]GAP07610.1 protein containing PAS domain S-box [Anaerolinea thermolimosa]HCE16663.1 PAS domain-containing sensor histidine kinase [Anaerolinea thermolimosa]
MAANRSPRLNLPVAGLVFLFILYLAWLLWADPDPRQAFLTGGLTLCFTASLPATFAWQTWRVLPSGRLRRAWRWVAFGLGLWALAAALRLGMAALWPSGVSNRFSLPDILWAGGNALLVVGWLLWPEQSRSLHSRLQSLSAGVITSLSALALAWLVVLKPLANVPAPRLLYPALDLALLILLLDLSLLKRGPTSGLSLAWLVSGLVAHTISDWSLALLTAETGYPFGSPIGIGWVLGNLLLLGWVWQSARAVPASEEVPAGQPFLQRTLAGAQALVPLVLTITLGWYTLIEWQINGQPDPIGLWGTILLGMALIGSQGLLAGELEYQKYARLVESLAEPAFICSATGELRLVNPAFLEVCGASPEARLLGLPLGQWVQPAQAVPAMLQAGLRGGWSGEVTLQRADGTPVPVMLSLRPLLWGRREQLALAGTAHDLSEIKRQQAALQTAYEQVASAHAELGRMNLILEERVAEKTASLTEAYAQLERQNLALQNLDRLKSDFVSLVSHELRAPLTNINAGIELLLARPRNLPVAVRRTLQLVQAEIRRLTHFIETILDLSALDAGRAPVYPAPLDIHSVVSAIQRQMTHLPGAERIHWNLPSALPDFLADERALTSVLFHLVDNALKYAPEGPVEVTAGMQDGLGWLSVRDHGPGIAEADLPLLFTRFFRARSSDAQTVYGHGLGLYMVQRLLEAMNGTIRVENHPEGGARFICWLPLAQEEESGEEHELENSGRG